MGALLVSMAAAGILMSAALPVWSQAAKREREAERFSCTSALMPAPSRRT